LLECSDWHSGKIRCGLCDWSYISSGGKGKAKFQTLHCENRRKNGIEKTTATNGKSYGCTNRGINEQVLLLSMERILEHISVIRDEVIEDLLREIAQIQKTDKVVDTAPLQAEIEKIGAKKQGAIDLMLEGLSPKTTSKNRLNFTIVKSLV
jgi:hypothetical protein